jgi:hypothetical protein
LNPNTHAMLSMRNTMCLFTKIFGFVRKGSRRPTGSNVVVLSPNLTFFSFFFLDECFIPPYPCRRYQMWRSVLISAAVDLEDISVSKCRHLSGILPKHQVLVLRHRKVLTRTLDFQCVDTFCYLTHVCISYIIATSFGFPSRDCKEKRFTLHGCPRLNHLFYLAVTTN